MRVLVGIATATLLCSGCVPDDEGAKEKIRAPATQPQDAGEFEPAPPANGSPVAVTGQVKGQVSALTSDISDLNVRITSMGTVIDLPSDALFEFDKADLTPSAAAQLRKAGSLVARAPAGAIQIVGHTDSKGDDAYNQTLSEARARTVANWFGQQVGIRQREFVISGKGETAPIAPNETATGADDPAGRAKNRRVEVILPR